MQAEKDRKMATPPKRGKGLECRWRSCVGTATKPRADAKSRTYRVSTKADSSDKKNIAKKIRLNYLTSASGNAGKRDVGSAFFQKYCSNDQRLIVSEQIPATMWVQ